MNKMQEMGPLDTSIIYLFFQKIMIQLISWFMFCKTPLPRLNIRKYHQLIILNLFDFFNPLAERIKTVFWKVSFSLELAFLTEASWFQEMVFHSSQPSASSQMDPLAGTRPVYAIAEPALSSISIATFTSAGKKRRAKATETKEINFEFLMCHKTTQTVAFYKKLLGS